MKKFVTWVLSGLVAVLTGHIVIVSQFPQLIAQYYPDVVARVYAASLGKREPSATVRLEPVPGRPGIMRVLLSADAVKRLGIKTVKMAQKRVNKVRSVAGTVIAASAAPGSVKAAATGAVVIVRVTLAGAAKSLALGRNATVRTLAIGKPGSNGAAELPARPIGLVLEQTATGQRPVAYYIVKNEGHRLQPGTPVIVTLPLPDTNLMRLTVPAAAVIYDPRGRTWVYTNPEPMVYVRHVLKIKFMDADAAVLSAGPPIGTRIVTVGAFELFGAESKIGF